MADDAMEQRLLERIEQIETRLLTEFRKWAVRIEGAARVQATQLSTFNDRLQMVEERLDELEAKH